METIKAYQLHDTETEEILGTVYVKKPNDESENELWEGWEGFNKLKKHELDPENVELFVGWFNKNYVVQIGLVDLNFIQL